MAIPGTSNAQQTGDSFSALYSYQYVALATFRKDGKAVVTPVWFAPDQGKLYVMTVNHTGKIKRIRNNGQVVLAPCNAGGKVLGAEVEARARELPVTEQARAIAALTKKYGFMYRMFTFFQKIRKVSRTYIEIEPMPLQN